MGLPFRAWPKDAPAPETSIDPPSTHLWRPYATDYTYLSSPFPTISTVPAMAPMAPLPMPMPMSPFANHRPMPIPSLGQTYAVPFGTPAPPPLPAQMMTPLPFAAPDIPNISPYHALAPIAQAARESDVSLAYVRDTVESATNGDWSTRPDYATYAVIKGWAEDDDKLGIITDVLKSRLKLPPPHNHKASLQRAQRAPSLMQRAVVLCQLLPLPALAQLHEQLAPLAAESLTDTSYPLIISIARDLHPLAVAAKAEADEKQKAADNKYKWDIWTGMTGLPAGGHAWRSPPAVGEMAWGQYLLPHSVGSVGYIPADMWWTRWPTAE